MSTPTPSEDPLEDLTVVPSGRPGGGCGWSAPCQRRVEGGCHLLAAAGRRTCWSGSGERSWTGSGCRSWAPVRRDMLTTCQEGVPFLVERVVSGTP